MAKRFRFIHCADLHLGTPLGDVAGQQAHWDTILRDATKKAFVQIADLAIEKHVDAVIIAGDVYNSADHSLAAQLDFAKELYRLANVGIRTYIAHGNHDPMQAWRAEVPLPPTVHVFRSDRVEGIPLLINGEHAATIYGRSYAQRHVDEHWVRDYQREENVPYAIGVLHTQGPQAAGEQYVPCTREELRESKMDYWALGHVHTQEILSTEPYVVYPGNPQGLDRTETGPRGCYLVEVGNFGTTMLEFYETDAVRRENWQISIDEFEDIEQLVQYIADYRKERREVVGKPILATISTIGRGRLHHVLRDRQALEQMMDRLNEQEYYKHIFVYCHRWEDLSLPIADWQARRELPDATGDYLRTYDLLSASPTWLTSCQDALAMRPEWVKYEKWLGTPSPEKIKRAWQKAEAIGAERILGGDTDEID